MTVILKQSTAVTVQFGPFLDKTNGVDLEAAIAAATLDHITTGIRIAKNGGTLAARNATVTATAYDAMDLYKVTLDTTDTATLGVLRMIYEDSATCLPVWQDFTIVKANIYDTLFNTDVFDVSLVQVAGATTNVAALATNVDAVKTKTDSLTFTVAGDVDCNVESWKGATAAAVDTAGYPVVTIKDGTGQGEILTAAGAINAVGLVSGDIGGLSANAVSDVAAAVWNAATVTYGAAGSYGLLVETNLDVVLSERTLLAASYFDAITDTVDVGSWLGTAVTKSINNVPDINVKEINDVPITGDGTGGDPFDVV